MAAYRRERELSRLFRLQVDKEALTDELFEWVTDPRPGRNTRPVVRELRDFAPGVIYVMENMILDGVDDRQYVADYVHAVFDRGEDEEVYLT
jgi:hypothetical protein